MGIIADGCYHCSAILCIDTTDDEYYCYRTLAQKIDVLLALNHSQKLLFFKKEKQLAMVSCTKSTFEDQGKCNFNKC